MEKKRKFNHNYNDLISLDTWCKDIGLKNYNASLENGRLSVLYDNIRFVRAKDLCKYKIGFK